MCYAVQCPSCGKTTWDGCGQHIDDVMRSVPAAQRCSCVRATEAPRKTTGRFWRR